VNGVIRSDVKTKVLIVGAGPTGLVLAAELRRRDVDCLLIDAREEPRRWDRATIVHPRSLELFATVGIVDRFLEAGVHQWGIRIFAGGEQLGELDLAESGSRYGFNLDLSEEVTEAIITEHLEAHGGSVSRGHELVGLERHEDHVLATVAHDGGSEEIWAEWIVGCGGLRSPVRELIGIPFEGHDIAAPWAVFDVTLAGWSSDLDVNFGFFDDPPVILTPLPGQRWRAYLRPSSPDSDLVAEAAAVIAAHDPGAELVDVENPRRFDCQTRVAARYRDGRILLAGDAAHVCTPGQGHGMNTGIQDSFNLAWKLAHVVKGEAEEALLDSYEAERRPVARTITSSGDAMEAMMAIGPGPEREARNRSLREAFADPESRRDEVVAEVEVDVEYSGSPIVSGEAEVLAGGARLPTELQERVGPEHTLMLLTRNGSAADTAEGRGELEAAGDGFFDATLAVELDPEGAARLGVEGPTILAIRPDHYIGLRHDAADIGPVRAYVDLVRSGGRAGA
jgi:2-polyprenyl-6-methoxyphenol hydroxylase-like FAD-dependent oxidoreductase